MDKDLKPCALKRAEKYITPNKAIMIDIHSIEDMSSIIEELVAMINTRATDFRAVNVDEGQKVIFSIKQNGDEQTVNLHFDPPLCGEVEFEKLSTIEKYLQNTAGEIANYVMNAMEDRQ